MNKNGTMWSAKLQDMAKSGLLPTVQTQGLKVCEKKKTKFMDLGLLPMPQAAEGYKLTGGENQNSLTKLIGKSSQLNPLFVGEMMGYPLDWLTGPFLQKVEQESLPESKLMEDGEKKV
jgi:hypothetical protein